jgi:hypothetical protein
MAALMVHDAEIVQGLDVFRLTREQAVVATRRVGVAAGLVKLESGRQN